MLADVLADQFVLGQAVQRAASPPTLSRKRGLRVDRSRSLAPSAVDPQRLEREPATRPRRERPQPRRSHRLVSQPSSPSVSAIRTVSWLRLAATSEPPARPMGRRGLGRSQQHEEARLGERRLDRRPQLRGGGQTRLVAKDAQRPSPVPRLSERLTPACSAGAAAIRRVAVGDERVVGAVAGARGRLLWWRCHGGRHERVPPVAAKLPLPGNGSNPHPVSRGMLPAISQGGRS